MSAEVLLAAAYAGALVIGAFVLEWLSAHTHRRALRYRTAGFTYDEAQDHWQCPEGEHLWPHEFDHERRLVRYRAKAHVCNGCPRKAVCTDSDRGREIVKPLDPWPHSEAGRFHRIISLVMVVVAALLMVVEASRHHRPAEIGLVLAALTAAALAASWLLRDLRAHPANFPSTTAPGVGLVTTNADGRRPHSRWASQTERIPAKGAHRSGVAWEGEPRDVDFDL